MPYRKYAKLFMVGVFLIALLTACGPKAAATADSMENQQDPQTVFAKDPAEAPAAVEESVVEPVAEDMMQTEPEPVSEPALMPGEPPEPVRILEDADGSLRAYENRALTGDRFLDNRYERSFTSETMEYLPEVDIQTAAIASDETFIYVTITPKIKDSETGDLAAQYGVEFDRTKTGRGDLLVLASEPQKEWSDQNLTIYADENGNVGGLRPTVAEEGIQSDGYETMVEPRGELVAYARVAPDDPGAIQIAVSRALLDNAEEFLWGAWADKVIHDPSKFDYNDAFGLSEAGSPIKPSEDYPLGALHSLDNTCRLPFGFDALSGIPGICVSIPVVEKEEGKDCVCVQYIYLGNTRVCAQERCS